jgi:hypothetical protein
MVPEVVGLTLGDVKNELEHEGIEIESIEVTSPPRQKSLEAEDFYRVIRMEITSTNKARLLVCKPL